MYTYVHVCGRTHVHGRVHVYICACVWKDTHVHVCVLEHMYMHAASVCSVMCM